MDGKVIVTDPSGAPPPPPPPPPLSEQPFAERPAAAGERSRSATSGGRGSAACARRRSATARRVRFRLSERARVSVRFKLAGVDGQDGAADVPRGPAPPDGPRPADARPLPDRGLRAGPGGQPLARQARARDRALSFTDRRYWVAPRREHDRDTDPGAAGPLAVVALPLDGGDRPRDGLDPRRPRGHDRRLDRGAADGEGQRARAHAEPGPDRGLDLRRGGLRGRAVLRPAHGPVRPQEALPGHAGAVPGGHGGDGLRRLGALLLRRPLLHRRRHRRRVRGDQLGDRRADPGARARARGPDHQRLVLARRGGRGARRSGAAGHQHLRPRRRLAAGVPDRRGARRRHPGRAPPRAREPALAVHPRPRRGGGADRRRDRGRGALRDWPGARGAGRLDHGAAAQDDLVPRDRLDGVQGLPAPHRARAGAVRRPGVHLQRRHLRARHVPGRVLRHRVRPRAGLHRAVRVQQLPRPAAAGAPVRHGRAQADDRRDLPRLGGRARAC